MPLRSCSFLRTEVSVAQIVQQGVKLIQQGLYPQSTKFRLELWPHGRAQGLRAGNDPLQPVEAMERHGFPTG